jgi:hypothetical protein
LTREAASSIASGKASSRSQISRISGSLWVVTAKVRLNRSRVGREERDGVVSRQRTYRIFLFGKEAKRFAARCNDAQIRAAGKQLADRGCRLDDVFKAVQHQEHRLSLQVIPQRLGDRPPRPFAQAERLGDRRDDELGFGHRIEADEEGSVEVLVEELSRRL